MPHCPHPVDWQEELREIAPELPGLPPAARRLILEIVASFLEEDAAAGAPAERLAPVLHAVAA